MWSGMLLNTIVVVAFGFFISQVHAGSRLWQSSKTLVGRRLHRRAISIKPEGGQNGKSTWPDKKLKYCFADANAREKLRGPFAQASLTSWGALRDLGFSYEEEENVGKCDKDRVNYLKIHYNDEGFFSCTPGKQAVDEAYNRKNPNNQYLGPTMHLSDREDVGMLDLVANVAHEIGHAWGLYHEHQNPVLWELSNSDMDTSKTEGDIWFEVKTGNNPVFRPSQFHCTALADYAQVHAKAQELAAKTGAMDTVMQTFCSVQSVAAEIGFSAKEWLPYGNGVKYIGDDEFDEDSIMLYPSGAGGTRGAGPDGGRALVLTLANGVQFKMNVLPSERDIERLRVLYSSDIAGIQQLHIRGPKKSIFDRIKKALPKRGSAKDKAC